MRTGIALAALLLVAAAPPSTFAQTARGDRPAPAVELLAGWTGFSDDSTIDHTIFGGSARAYLSPRIAVGPEIVYMRGPGNDRDLFVTGNLTFDLLPPQRGRPPRVSPFVVAGGGFFRHSDRFGSSTFESYEGAVTGGGGVRVWVTERVYAAADFRLGWELHARVNGAVGVGF